MDKIKEITYIMRSRSVEILGDPDFWEKDFAWIDDRIEYSTTPLRPELQIVYTQEKRKPYWFWHTLYKIKHFFTPNNK